MRTERWGLMALLVVTLVWGTTFPAMKLLSAQLDALQIIWGRFAIALLVLAPLWWGMRRSERFGESASLHHRLARRGGVDGPGGRCRCAGATHAA